MKKLFIVLLAAIVGGLAALGGAQLFGLNQEVRYVETPAPAATSFAKYNTTDPVTTTSVRPAPTDGFVTAADKALPAVVHIKAAKRGGGGMSMRGGQLPFGIDPDQLPEGFRDLFGNPGGGGERSPEMPLQRGSGSGVIITGDGYIVTNNHVIEDAEELEVVLNDGQTFEAELVGTDPTTDIAVIKIEGSGLNTIQFANSDNVKVGEWVVAVGNPFSLTNTVTAGIVSAKGRNIDIIGQRGQNRYAIESFIQTDAVVNPGNSGGALVNQNGDLIGINTAISSPTGVFAGYSFAVPSAIVQKVVKDLRDYGVVQRGLLGAGIVQINTAFAKEQNIDRNDGVYVREVMPNSAAEEGGIEVGDIIVGVDGVTTLRNSDLLEQLGRRRPGDRVTLTVDRDGRERQVSVTLKNREGSTGPVTRIAEPEALAFEGAQFEELDEETAAEFSLEGGAIVSDIQNGLVSESTRMRPGFVITKINGRNVRTAKDLSRMLDQSNGTVTFEGFYPSEPERMIKYGVVR